MRDLLWTDRQRAFGRDKADKLIKQCRSCQFRFACNGGCPKHRFAKAKDGEEGHNYFCESYTEFFRHAGAKMQKMAHLVAAGRPAAEVVDLAL